MATATLVHLSTSDISTLDRSTITSEQLKVTSEFLQVNHDKNHAFFNGVTGFHDHIVHHLLTLASLNASVGQIENAYKTNAGYQRSRDCYKDVRGKDLSNVYTFKSCLGKQEHYDDFLEYFQAKIQETNYRDVVLNHLFAGDSRANDLLIRLFAGLLHPLIHFGFGIESKQPAIVAEALAQTSIHSDDIGCLLEPAFTNANARSKSQTKTIVKILDEIKTDQHLAKMAKSGIPDFQVPNFVKRAGEHFINIVGQYQVDPNTLEEQTAEMINATVYFTAGAQRPDKRIIMDFLSIFLKQDWLKPANKAQLLQYEVHHNLASYAAIGAPTIRWDEVRDYKPKHPDMGWDGILARACAYVDDGHNSKLIRALAHGAEVCRPYEHKDSFRVKSGDWLQIAHMAMDATEYNEELIPCDDETEVVKGSHVRWLFGAGFDEPWNEMPARA